jgi:hypothetical protein
MSVEAVGRKIWKGKGTSIDAKKCLFTQCRFSDVLSSGSKDGTTMLQKQESNKKRLRENWQHGSFAKHIYNLMDILIIKCLYVWLQIAFYIVQ